MFIVQSKINQKQVRLEWDFFLDFQMMSFVQPLHQNLSSRILVSSLLSSRNEKQRILFLAKGGHVTTVTSIKNKMLFVVCIWIYICHTEVPIRLCQNNIIIVIFRTIGRQLRSCVQANPERWGKNCLQLNFIHLPSFSIYHLSITSFCLYLIFVIWYQVIKLHWLLALNTYTQ